MTTSNQLSEGMAISLDDKFFNVESSIKVSASKGNPFVKVKLRDLTTQKIVEKTFKQNQEIIEVTLKERCLEFLYPEKKGFLFLDVNNLEQIFIPTEIILEKVNYLKEGISLTAFCSKNIVFSVELPQFLEIMVGEIEDLKENQSTVANMGRLAILETGAKIEVPLFIEVGDIIKVDTYTGEFTQRV